MYPGISTSGRGLPSTSTLRFVSVSLSVVTAEPSSTVLGPLRPWRSSTLTVLSLEGTSKVFLGRDVVELKSVHSVVCD